MKKTGYLIFLTGIFLAACNTTNSSTDRVVPKETGPVDAAVRGAPFSKGVNFSGWFESFSASSIPFTKYTEQDFADVKSLGADVIRLPIKMHSMTNGAPDYRLDPLLLKFLDSAVDWAEKYGLFLIIDNHSFDPVKGLGDDIDKILLPVWDQIARRYKDRGDYLVYEILNEPHGISDSRWGEVQGMAIDTIRRVDQKHAIIVGGTDYNSIGKLSALPEYTDPNLIYTFHFYDPYLFSHQGATWGEPSLAPLAGVPFPADRKRMPRLPAALRGTWIESAFNNYENEAVPSKLYSTLDRVVSFSKARNVPVFCGEFGIYMIQSPPGDRVVWYEIVAAALDRRNISRTSWDYYGGFGVFRDETGDFNSDLNTEVVGAMGFTPPPQTPRSSQPLDAGFVIYGDYPGREFSVWYWGEDTDFSLYDTAAAQGEFAVRWGNADRYNIFCFGFTRNGNLSGLFSDGYSLEFRARAEKPVSFDVRFLNPESASSIPWRMRYSVNESVLPPDGRWRTIRIPLNQMQEHGAWIGARSEWITPRGEFSWANIKQLEFVAEDADLKGKTVWFDEIKIVK
jgi:endoglucanase